MLHNTTQIEASPTQPDLFLTLEDAVEEIAAMGFKNVRLRQVQRWANEGKLPFFRLGKRFYIERQTLKGTFRAMQTQATSQIALQ